MSHWTVIGISFLVGLSLAWGYLAYLSRKPVLALWKSRTLFRYSWSLVRPHLWTWTRSQFFSHDLMGAMACAFMLMPIFQMPSLIGNPKWEEWASVAVFTGLSGIGVGYLSFMTSLKVLVKKWVVYLEQSPEVVEKTKAIQEKELALKFKKKLKTSLPEALQASPTIAKRRL